MEREGVGVRREREGGSRRKGAGGRQRVLLTFSCCVFQ